MAIIRRWLIRTMPLDPESRNRMRQILKDIIMEHQMNAVTALPKGQPYSELAAHAVASTMTDDEFRRRLGAAIDAMDDKALKETFIRVDEDAPGVLAVEALAKMSKGDKQASPHQAAHYYCPKCGAEHYEGGPLFKEHSGFEM